MNTLLLQVTMSIADISAASNVKEVSKTEQTWAMIGMLACFAYILWIIIEARIDKNKKQPWE